MVGSLGNKLEPLHKSCYGLNCVPIKCILWSPNTQCDCIFEDRAFKDITEVQMRS